MSKMSVAKVAVVTGANKGIGYAIVKGLCEGFQGKVYLTARDVGRGEQAVKKLEELGLRPIFHQLDITDNKSIVRFRDYIASNEGGIDILVNNAAIAFKSDAEEPFAVQADVTTAVNYFATLDVCNALFPLLRKNARVVNLSSSAGHLARIPSGELRAKFGDPELTIAQLNELIKKFVSDAKAGKHEEEGWGSSAYVVSKVGVSALSIIQQRAFDAEQSNRNISVNHVHPGYVDTDMTSHKGPLTIWEGAKAPLFLCLDEHNLRGQYVWFDCQVIDWYGEKVGPL